MFSVQHEFILPNLLIHSYDERARGEPFLPRDSTRVCLLSVWEVRFASPEVIVRVICFEIKFNDRLQAWNTKCQKLGGSAAHQSIRDVPKQTHRSLSLSGPFQVVVCPFF